MILSQRRIVILLLLLLPFAAGVGASSSSKGRDVHDTKIPGLFWKRAKSKYVIDIDWMFSRGGVSVKSRIRDGLKFFFRGGFRDFWDSTWALYGRKTKTTTTIYDARQREIEENLSKAEFFNKYGFVLLKHESMMDADGWLESDREVNKLLFAYNSIDENNSTTREEYDSIMDD